MKLLSNVPLSVIVAWVTPPDLIVNAPAAKLAVAPESAMLVKSIVSAVVRSVIVVPSKCNSVSLNVSLPAPPV